MVKPLDSYIRVSEVGSREGASYQTVDEQRRAIADWAKRNNVALGEETIEEDVRGKLAASKRRLWHLLDRCESGQSGGIIVAWQDRLSRQRAIEQLEVWERLQKAGARFVAVNDGVDTDTGDSEPIFTVRAAIARDQWKRYARNWEDTKRNAAERGNRGGAVPFGYRRTVKGIDPKTGKPRYGQFALDPKTAPLARELFTRRAGGESWASLARWLESKGVRNPDNENKPYGRSAMQVMIANRTYTGELHVKGIASNLAAHPPIVTPLEFALANEANSVTGRKPAKAGTTAGKTLTQGLAVCGSCGSRLQVYLNNRGALAFACKATFCPAKTYISATALDSFVLASLEDHIGAMEVRRDFDPERDSSSGLESAQRAYDSARFELETIQTDTDLLATLGIEGLRKLAASYAAKVEEAARNVAELEKTQTLPSLYQFSDMWLRWSHDRRRSELAKFIERITVAPARGQRLPASERVTIEWKSQ